MAKSGAQPAADAVRTGQAAWQLQDNRASTAAFQELQAVVDQLPPTRAGLPGRLAHGPPAPSARPTMRDAGTEPDRARAPTGGHWSQSLIQNIRQRRGDLKHPAEAATPVAQFIFTRPQSVAADMHHPEWDNIFDDVSNYNYLWEGFRANWNRRGRVAAIVSRIDDGLAFSYSQLSDETLTSAADLIALDGAGGEHMYVHHGDTLHSATRADDEKKPHPTLVGGNPDVTCAGTIDVAHAVDDGHTTYTVTITNSSGHFRPPDIPNATQERFEAIAEVDVPEDTTVTIAA